MTLSLSVHIPKSSGKVPAELLIICKSSRLRDKEGFLELSVSQMWRWKPRWAEEGSSCAPYPSPPAPHTLISVCLKPVCCCTDSSTWLIQYLEGRIDIQPSTHWPKKNTLCQWDGGSTHSLLESFCLNKTALFLFGFTVLRYITALRRLLDGTKVDFTNKL